MTYNRDTAAVLVSFDDNRIAYERTHCAVPAKGTVVPRLAELAGTALVREVFGRATGTLVRPHMGTANCVGISVSLSAIYDLLIDEGLEQFGQIEDRILQGPAADGPDGPLLDFAEHILRNFHLYEEKVGARRSRLAAWLLVDAFVSMLRTTGALKLQ